MQKPYKSQYSRADLEIVGTNETRGHFFKMTQYLGRYRRYEGDMSEVIEREVFTPLFDAAGMLLYDPVQKKIAITEQCRLGLQAGPVSPWVLEIVMGMMDNAGESAQAAAVREAMEEAGATVQRVEPIYNYYPSPGVSSERVHIFCGEVDIDTVGGVHGVAAENEDIKVVVMSLSQAEQAMQSGVIKAATTIIALQWLLLKQESLWV